MNKKIGTICLPTQNDTAFYPLIWLIIKTTIETKSKNNFVFLDPILLHKPVTKSYYLNTDIMFASFYTWNREATEKLLEEYKLARPDGIIIVGGPHVLDNDESKYDYVVTGEAETCVHLILDKICGSNINKIPNTKSKNLDIHYSELHNDFSVSPYLYQAETLFDLKKRLKLNLGVVFETNRGCPYGCTFCDWGQATLSKIRLRPLELIKKEIDLFAELKINIMFLADANFGILPRDLEIAQYMATIKSKTGYIKTIVYSNSKNNMQRNLEIGEILYKADLIQTYIFSLQHTDKEVLNKIHRINLPETKLKESSNILLEKNIPTAVQMILGNPGDTLTKWKQTLMHLLEMNMHDHIQILYFAILPGAPANDPTYLKEYQIKISKIKYNPNLGSDRNYNAGESIITSTNTFTQQEWIEMNIFSRVIQSTHEMGLTKPLSIYLHNNNIMSYSNFYEQLFETLQIEFYDLFNSLREALQLWINTDNSSLNWNPNGIVFNSELEYKMAFYFIKLKDRFYNVVKHILSPFYNDKINDLISWQKKLIIDYNYDPTKGVIYDTKYDWHSWYKNRKWNLEVQPRVHQLKYSDTHIVSEGTENNFLAREINFHNFSGIEREKMFIHQIIVGRYRCKNRFMLKKLTTIN